MGSMDIYRPEYLVAKDVVYVTVQGRIGILGRYSFFFLSFFCVCFLCIHVFFINIIHISMTFQPIFDVFHILHSVLIFLQSPVLRTVPVTFTVVQWDSIVLRNDKVAIG